MPKGLDYVINLKDGDFGGASKAKSAVQGIDEAVEKTGNGITGLNKLIVGAGLAIAGIFAVDRVIDFGKESRAAFLKSEAAAAQVSVAIQHTNGIAGKGLDELREKAEALEKTTLFGDEQTLQADSLLLTFTNIRGTIFDQAIPAIQDLAQRMAGDGPADLKGAAIQVGKALNDPITGINALRRVGVSFSDTQKELIANAVKHGDVMKAQGMILKELNTEFGGSAAAARQVLGPTGDLDHEIEELKKSFGHLINDGLKVVVPWLLKGIEALKGIGDVFSDTVQWVEDNAVYFKALGIAVGTATVAFLVANPAIIAYGVEMGVSAIATGALAVAQGVLTAAQWALNVAMDANPIGLIITGIGLLASGIYIAYQKSEVFRAILAGIGAVAKSIFPIFKGLGEVIWGALTFDPAMIKKGFEDSVNGVKDIINNGGIGGVFEKGAMESVRATEKEKREHDNPAAPAKPASASEVFKPKQGNQPYSVSGTGKGSKGEGSDTVSSGKSVRNVKVTIGNLVSKIEVHTTNLQGVGAGELKRRITEILTGAVHDSELALGSQ